MFLPHVTTLCNTTPNSSPIIRTNSETHSWAPHLYDPVSFHFRSPDPTLTSCYVFPFVFPFQALLHITLLVIPCPPISDAHLFCLTHLWVSRIPHPNPPDFPYMFNTFCIWKVLYSLFAQTPNYISRTNSCILWLIFDIVLSEHYSLKSSSCSMTLILFLVVLCPTSVFNDKVISDSNLLSDLQPDPCLQKLGTRQCEAVQHISWSQVPPTLTHSDIRTSRLHSRLMYFDPLVIFTYWVLARELNSIFKLIPSVVICSIRLPTLNEQVYRLFWTPNLLTPFHLPTPYMDLRWPTFKRCLQLWTLGSTPQTDPNLEPSTSNLQPPSTRTPKYLSNLPFPTSLSHFRNWLIPCLVWRPLAVGWKSKSLIHSMDPMPRNSNPSSSSAPWTSVTNLMRSLMIVLKLFMHCLI